MILCLKVVGMLPVYNEEDIVEEVIDHLISQGLDLVVLDNGSTDNSYKICEKFAKKNLITLKEYKTKSFDFPLILRILYDMALAKNPDWLIRSDQDEFLESGKNNLTLKDAIIQEDSRGYNIIQFDCFEFFMSDNDNMSSKSVKEKFPNYSWQHDFVYRAWKHIPGTRVEDGAGHYPIFPEGYRYKIAPQKFVLRHYRFRNTEQSLRNNQDRLNRIINIPERKIGWYTHFEKISKGNFSDPVDHNLLNEYKNDNDWKIEKKYQPYVMADLPVRSALFNEDGQLAWHRPTSIELRAEIKEKDDKISQLEKLNQISQDEKNKIDETDLQKTRPFLIITGMHRSGTSFLVRSLNLAGVYLGNIESIVSHDWLSHKDNLRGHWENRKILRLLRKTLELNKGSWKNIPPKIEVNEELGKEIQDVIHELDQYPSFLSGFKDPSILICLDSWKKYLPQNIIMIGIFRNPLQVAESLHKRNNLSYEDSLNLWKIYNEKLLEYLKKQNGFLLNFDWPKEKLLTEIYHIIKKLGLADTINLSEWYTEELITNDKTENSVLVIPNEIKDLYAELIKRSELNDTVDIKPHYHSEKEYRMIAESLCSELQNQGNNFKTIYDNYLEMLKGKEKQNKFELPASLSLSKAQEEILERQITWIISTGKSGSTWFANLLENSNNHLWLEPAIGLHLGLPLKIKLDQKTMVQKPIRLYDKKKVQSKYLFSDSQKPVWRPALRKLILNRAYSEAKTINKNIIIKDPTASLSSDIIFECFPNSKLIYLVRDGRDNVGSNIAWHGKKTSRRPPIKNDNQRLQLIKDYSYKWCENQERIFNTFQKIDPKRRLQVKYENLVNNTFDEIKKVYNFLGIHPSEAELNNIIEKNDYEIIPESEKDLGLPKDLALVGRWKKDFSMDEQAIIYSIMEETLNRLGYVF